MIDFIYSETVKSDRYVIFRDAEYSQYKSEKLRPLAFISHDSRDKDAAHIVAQYLSNQLCPVWFDEYTLKVGDSLIESIQKGLKECSKCILILSKNFISNTGWTKFEFNSILTREIAEKNKVILPVWRGVTKQDVYEYSPILSDRLALMWHEDNLNDQDNLCDKLLSELRR